MPDCSLIETLPTPADYNRLRKAVGWGEYDEDVIENALPSTLYCVCAFIGKEVVGMARVIGDAGMVFYIQDVIVLPKYQGQGIGTQMMDAVMAYIGAHAHKNTIIGLMAAAGKESFYEKYGFHVRPDKTHGAGMTQFWRNKNG
jgi:ribosomal protein S18 acetylase RimI-like enzyme